MKTIARARAIEAKHLSPFPISAPGPGPERTAPPFVLPRVRRNPGPSPAWPPDARKGKIQFFEMRPPTGFNAQRFGATGFSAGRIGVSPWPLRKKKENLFGRPPSKTAPPPAILAGGPPIPIGKLPNLEGPWPGLSRKNPAAIGENRENTFAAQIPIGGNR